jgi:protein Tex
MTVVEDCVNAVGVDVNTASALAARVRISGLNRHDWPPSVWLNTATRTARSAARDALKKVAAASDPRPSNRRPASCACPTATIRSTRPRFTRRRYPLVQRIARDLGIELRSLVGDPAAVSRIEPRSYVGDGIGLPTLEDIIAELQKPGRDPREAFEAPEYRDDVESLADLKEGMTLQGTVTNVVAFGAFVDVGVHQDGLVHISELADKYVQDPNAIVKVGDRVKVRVLSVDVARQRIALSMKSAAEAGGSGSTGSSGTGSRPGRGGDAAVGRTGGGGGSERGARGQDPRGAAKPPSKNQPKAPADAPRKAPAVDSDGFAPNGMRIRRG